MIGPKCLKCGRVQCQLVDLPHDATTSQIVPGFENIKAVDFTQALDVAMKGVKVVKSIKRPGKRTPAKRYKNVNAPPAPKGSSIGGGDIRKTAAEKAFLVKSAGGDPSKIFTGGELPKGGPLIPYEPTQGALGFAGQGTD